MTILSILNEPISVEVVGLVKPRETVQLVII